MTPPSQSKGSPSLDAPRIPIEYPHLHAGQLRDAARIIENYEGIYAYPKSLAEHFCRVADEMERSVEA